MRINRDQDDQIVFTRRTVMLGGFASLLFGTVAARLYSLQVIESAHYTELAEDNRVNRRLIAPIRGKIRDRFGIALASNDQNFRVVLIPEQTADDRGRLSIEATLDRLARLIPISDRQRERVLKEARTGPKFRPILVAEGLTWDQFARINILVPDLPGVQPEIGERRAYPYGAELSHVLGYVGRVSDADIEELRDRAWKAGTQLSAELEETLRLPTFRIGKNGIEYALEEELRGTAGARNVEVNAFGREIKEVSVRPGQPGKEVELTLDYAIQNYTMKRVAGESAAVVVLDILTGDILAIASAPGFDPNPFGIGLTPEQWALLRDDEKKPLLNKTIAGLYPPGSTFKMVTALAAVESGRVNPEQTFYCGGRMYFGDHAFHCWKKEGHGWMNLHQGIKKSCDIYFYEVARAAGIDQIAETARRLGLGSNYEFIIPGTKSGLIPDSEWKRTTRGEQWYEGETLSAGIGQGYIQTTPLQLAVMVARIANGGLDIKPRIVRKIGGVAVAHPAPASLGFDPDHMARVRAGMNGVSNEIGGTAYSARITEPGFELCGKTGTAQVRRITMEERATGVIKNEDLPWKLRDHALFVAFAPADAPRYAISVIVDHGGGGSKAAAPIGRDVMLYTQKRNPLSATPNIVQIAEADLGSATQ